MKNNERRGVILLAIAVLALVALTIWMATETVVPRNSTGTVPSLQPAP